MDISHFFIAAGITFLFSFVTSLFYYYKFFKKEICVAIVIYSLLIFCIVFFVSFESNIGLGIGLLGILSLIRLRSTPENLIDIGFIFYAITIGLLNASIADIKTIVIVNLFLTPILLLLTSEIIFKKNLLKTQVVFDEIFTDKINDIEFLKKKIKEKYDIEAINVRITNVNYLRDSVTLEIIYDARSN